MAQPKVPEKFKPKPVSEELRQQFVECIERNRKLLAWKAHKRKNVFNDVEDLISEGIATAFIGLKNFDSEKGSMDAFVSAWFDGGVKNHLRDHGHPMKLPRDLGERPYPIVLSMNKEPDAEGDEYTNEKWAVMADPVNVEREATLGVDLQVALDALKPAHQELIRRRYLDKEQITRIEMAEEKGMTRQALGGKENRALKKLREAMRGWE